MNPFNVFLCFDMRGKHRIGIKFKFYAILWTLIVLFFLVFLDIEGKQRIGIKFIWDISLCRPRRDRDWETH